MSAAKRKGTATLAERLARRTVITPSGCHEWTGYCHPTRGYGQIGLGVRSAGIGETHRVAYELAHGPIPPGMFVCHRCDNPPCVNPDHLFLGTHTDNMRDMVTKGRGSGARGLRNHNARLTDEQVQEIRAQYVPGVNASKIARRFGISRQYVRELAQGKWRKVA